MTACTARASHLSSGSKRGVRLYCTLSSTGASTYGCASRGPGVRHHRHGLSPSRSSRSRLPARSLEEGGTHSKSLVDLLRAEVTLDKAQLTDSYDIGRIYAAPCPKIHALPEERITQLGASAFPFGEWNILSVSISPIIRAACGRIQIQSRGRRTDQRRSEPQQVWRPAPSELAISIFWNMLQASAPPPSHVCTNLSHHYTRLIKA